MYLYSRDGFQTSGHGHVCTGSPNTSKLIMIYLLFFLLVRVGVDLEEGLPHVTGHSIFQYVNQLNSAQSPLRLLPSFQSLF